MKCLVLTDTFPNRLEPWRGVYNRRQIEELGKLSELTILNPLPWTRVVRRPKMIGLLRGMDDVLEGIPMYHPLLWYVPGLGRNWTWRGVVRAARKTVEERELGPFDLILATFVYPHGTAAMHLAGELGVPYVVKARGSDLHQLPLSGARREAAAQALQGAAAVVAVSGNLAEIARDLGAPDSKIRVLPNGVDVSRFSLIDRSAARRDLGVPVHSTRIALFVGNLLPVKGLDVLIEALSEETLSGRFDGELLVPIAGDGRMRRRLERQLSRNGLNETVRLLGRLSREEVALWMNAADVLVLPSRNEGCPNVVLEALCCGTPVVASRVGAVPDLLDDASGTIVPPEDPQALARGIKDALGRNWNREHIRSRVEEKSWENNARQMRHILTDAVTAGGGCPLSRTRNSALTPRTATRVVKKARMKMDGSKVFIRSAEERSVEEAVKEVMRSCRWEELVEPGATVVVKPNLCTPSRELIDVANVSPEVLAAVCKVLKERTDQVIIGESDGIRYTAEETFMMNRTYQVGAECGCEVLSFAQDEWVPVDHPHLDGWGLPRTLLECDVFVTVAKVKTHATTTFTGALKNQWGCLPQHDRILLHKYLHTLIGELNKILRPRLAVLDGRVAMEGRGPVNGQPVRLDLIMGSRDPVALDAAAMRFVGLDPAKAEHIVHAARIGVGRMEESEVEVDTDTESRWQFDPAEKDWPIKALNLLSRSRFMTKHVILNDTVFFPARWFANACRSVKARVTGGRKESAKAGRTAE